MSVDDPLTGATTEIQIINSGVLPAVSPDPVQTSDLTVAANEIGIFAGSTGNNIRIEDTDTGYDSTVVPTTVSNPTLLQIQGFLDPAQAATPNTMATGLDYGAGAENLRVIVNALANTNRVTLTVPAGTRFSNGDMITVTDGAGANAQTVNLTQAPAGNNLISYRFLINTLLIIYSLAEATEVATTGKTH